MPKNLLQNPESWKILETIENYNTLLEKIKWQLFQWLAYDTVDGLIFNKAYFSTWDNISQIIKEKESQANQKIIELTQLKDQVNNEEILNDAQKKLIISKIQREIDLFEYHKNAMYLEWEKAGQRLTWEQREYHNQKKLKLEQKLYWDPITKIEFRKDKALEKLNKLYENSAESKLNSEEQLFWKEKIQPMIDGTDTSKKQNDDENEWLHFVDTYIKEENIFKLIELALQIQWISPDNIVKIQYNTNKEQSDVRQENDIFIVPSSWKSEDIYKNFDSIWIWQKFKIIKKTSWTNSVSISKQWDKFKKNEISIWAPEKWRYNINKVLPIMFDHEIATHVNTWIWNFYNLNLNDSDRSDIEEWIATINESFAKDNPLSKYYESGKGDICQLFWEIFDDEDLKKAIEIYFKLSNDTEDVTTRFNRVRMWVAKWYKWTRRKDMVYGKWKNIVKELEDLSKTPEWIKLLNKYVKAFYSTKLWYNSIKDIDEILQWICDLEDLEPNFPVFAWKIIYRKLLKWKVNTDEMLKCDIRSLIETDKNISYQQKKLLVQILKLIKDDEEFQKTVKRQ